MDFNSARRWLRGLRIAGSGWVRTCSAGARWVWQTDGRRTTNSAHAAYDLYATPPNPLSREPIAQPLTTGIRVIDSMLPCGQGQRVGLFGGSGVG